MAKGETEVRTLNVRAAEDKLQLPYWIATGERNCYVKTALDILSPEQRDAVLKVAEELVAIMNDSESNPVPYRINHIRSDCRRYWVRYETEITDDDGNVFPAFEEETFSIKFDADQFQKDCEDKGVFVSSGEYDPYEYWVIARCGKNVTGMLYPSRLRALVFLSDIAKPPVVTSVFDLLPDWRRLRIDVISGKKRLGGESNG